MLSPVPERVANPRIREDRAVQDFRQNSDKMHRATHEDAYTRAWFDDRRIVFPQSVRKAGPNVDLYNVSTYHCSGLFNNMCSFNRKSEFRKAEHMDKPTSPNEKFNVTKDPQLSLLKEFWGNNYAHVILTAEAGSLLTDEKELIPQDLFAFHGNQMMTETDMQQSLMSRLAKREKAQPQNRASDRLNSSSTLWSLLRELWKAVTSVLLRTPLSLQQDASMTPSRGNW